MKPRPIHIRAAGGIVERREGHVLRIAVVHRTLYKDRHGAPDDWTLPKETWNPETVSPRLHVARSARRTGVVR